MRATQDCGRVLSRPVFFRVSYWYLNFCFVIQNSFLPLGSVANSV
jgi:hypothetical protein